MTGLAIYYSTLNTPLSIQNLQFPNAPWSNTPRKRFKNFNYAIFEARP